MEIKIHTEYIELQNVLKLEGIIDTGGSAKAFLESNEVLVNGSKETRRGRKLYKGDSVSVFNNTYIIK